MGKLKQPKYNTATRVKTSPRSEATHSSTNDEHPVFSFQYVVGDYCLTNCTKDELTSFANKLINISRLTWKEIQSQNKYALGTELISERDINCGIPSFFQGVGKFTAFRFCGKAPMVGYRVGAVFHVIWFDRNFTLYDHS